VVDRKNAQVRGKRQTRREAPDVQADEAQRLLNDPAFIRGFDAVKEGMINEIVNLKHDGQPATDDYERELCRTLRTLNSVRRAIAIGVQGQKLRLAEFQSQGNNGE
jgi:hypothetical protein